jgi:hypothetical protein
MRSAKKVPGPWLSISAFVRPSARHRRRLLVKVNEKTRRALEKR